MSTSSAPAAPPSGGLRRLRIRRGSETSGARVREHMDVAPVLDHLGELRMRLLLVIAALVVAAAGCYWQLERIFALLDRPLDDRYPVQTLGVTEPFFTSLSVAAQAAFVLVTPVAAWHTWRFIRPAIEPDARRLIRALLLAAPALFTLGVTFGYLVVLGPAVQFLLGMGSSEFDVVVRASEYYSFVATTLLAIGAAFCFPLLLIGLARIGLVTSDRLRGSRRIAYALMVVVAAMLPTADPISLALEILPLIGLYELSILAVQVQERAMARSASRAGEAR